MNPKKTKNYKTLDRILESVDTIVITGATSTSIILSIAGFGLNILPISAGIARALSLVTKVSPKLMKKNTKNILEEINKLLNLSINYCGKVYKIM